MTKHTETPWKLGHNHNDIFDVDNHVIGTTYIREVLGECQANAAHIVRCVNAHDALVAALQAVIEDLEYLEKDGWMSGSVHGGAYKSAIAALRDAGVADEGEVAK